MMTPTPDPRDPITPPPVDPLDPDFNWDDALAVDPPRGRGTRWQTPLRRSQIDPYAGIRPSHHAPL